MLAVEVRKRRNHFQNKMGANIVTLPWMGAVKLGKVGKIIRLDPGNLFAIFSQKDDLLFSATTDIHVAEKHETAGINIRLENIAKCGNLFVHAR